MMETKVVNCTPHAITVFTPAAAARLAEAAKRATALVGAAKELDEAAQRLATEEAAALWAEALAAETPLAVFPPSGEVARAAQTRREVGSIMGIQVGLSEFGSLEGLPEPQADTWYVVSGLALSAAPDRPDLLVPAQPVRDWKGAVIGCVGFDTTPAGAERISALASQTDTPNE